MGTPHYQAPEVLMEGRLSIAADVYSFGCLVWEIMEGSVPFGGMSLAQVLYRVALQHERPVMDAAQWPPGLAALVQECWAADAQARCGRCHCVWFVVVLHTCADILLFPHRPSFSVLLPRIMTLLEQCEKRMPSTTT